MKSKYLLILLVLSLMASACATTELVVNKAQVEKLQPGTPPNLNGVDYALPRTVIDIEVIAEKTITKPGPFAAYAERYLGVTDVPTRETSEWNILQVELNSHAERDPNQVYRIVTEGISTAGMLNLNEEGVITGVNMPVDNAYLNSDNSIIGHRNSKIDLPDYGDLTIRKNTEPMIDTIYRVVRTDTSFMRLPLLKSQVSQKNLNNQAEEAANLIMKLRKRRFYLLTGEYAYRPDVGAPMPDGEALQIIVRELAQLEYDYVSLFVGRVITEKEKFTFSYTPKNEGLTEASDLFVFSRFRGVLPAGNSNGDPVRINLSKTFDPQDTYSNNELDIVDPKIEIRKGVAYRIPGRAEILVNLNNDLLVRQEVPIAQYGVVQYLPVHIMSQLDIMIQFHSELGSLDGIYKK